jgi:hypothetical protein
MSSDQGIFIEMTLTTGGHGQDWPVISGSSTRANRNVMGNDLVFPGCSHPAVTCSHLTVRRSTGAVSSAARTGPTRANPAAELSDLLTAAASTSPCTTGPRRRRPAHRCRLRFRSHDRVRHNEPTHPAPPCSSHGKRGDSAQLETPHNTVARHQKPPHRNTAPALTHRGPEATQGRTPRLFTRGHPQKRRHHVTARPATPPARRGAALSPSGRGRLGPQP